MDRAGAHADGALRPLRGLQTRPTELRKKILDPHERKKASRRVEG